MGWAATSNGEILTGNDLKITINGNASYYAKWQKDNYILITWDRYFGNTGSAQLIRAPYYQEYNTTLSFLNTSKDKAAGINPNYQDAVIKNPDSDDGFTSENWYRDSACLNAINPSTDQLSQDANKISSGIRYLKWIMKNPVVNITGHPVVSYGAAVRLDNYVSMAMDISSGSEQDFTFP